LVRGLAKSSAKQLYAEQFTINDAAAKTSTLGQPATPAKKSPNGVLSPRLFSEMSPSATASKGFFVAANESCYLNSVFK
jgi:hypothetical protein